MADTKITDLAELTSPAANDLLTAVDVSDTSMAATGTNKKLTVANLGTLFDAAGAAAAAIAAHEGAADPHSQYLTAAEGNAAYAPAGHNHNGVYDPAGAAAAAQAASQPLDTQLTSLAGLGYSGNANKVIRVNAGESAFELATPAAGGTAAIDINTRTGAYTLQTTDLGDLVDFTTAGVTLALLAAATAGDTFFFYVRHSGAASALLTLDGDSAETIDGATTLVMHAGEVRLVICTGSAWVTIQLVPPRSVITPPVDSQFSWINQDSATIAQSRGGLVMSATGAGGDMNARIRIKSLPATPYTITAAFQFLYDPSASSTKPAVGIVLRQSSDGKLVCFDVNHVANTAGSAAVLNWRVAKWNSPTTSAPTSYAERSNFMPPGTVLLWMRISDDGSNRKCWVSANGDDWIQFGSNIAGTHTDFMTADQVGWFINPYNANVVATLVSWKES